MRSRWLMRLMLRFRNSRFVVVDKMAPRLDAAVSLIDR
jgi:hypothetical protein